MKLNQLENINDDLNEAPLGFLKKTGLGIASKFGGRTARGQLKTGAAANELYNDYLEFVGQYANTFQSKKPTTDSLLAYLEKKGLDKREFAQLIDKELQAIAPAPEVEPEKQEPTIDEPPAQDANDENNPLKPGNTSNIKTPGDIGNLDSDKSIPGATTPMPTQTSNAEKTATDAATQKIPSMAPKKKPGVRPQGGGKVKGQMSQTPNAIRKRNARAKSGSQLQLMSMYSEEAQRYRKNFERIDWTLKEDQAYYNALEFMGVMEAEIPKQVLNKILNIAAEKMPAGAPKQAQGGQQAQTQSPQQEPSGQQEPNGQQAQDDTTDPRDEEGKDTRGIFKKFVQGTKAGFQNPDDPNAQMDTDREIAKADDAEKKGIRGSLNYQNISKEFPGIDPVMLRRSFSKSLANKELSRQEQATMAQAMGELLKKDPAATVKVMNLFKQTREV